MPWFPAVDLHPPPQEARSLGLRTEEPSEGALAIGAPWCPRSDCHAEGKEAEDDGGEAAVDDEFCRLLTEALAGSKPEGPE